MALFRAPLRLLAVLLAIATALPIDPASAGTWQGAKGDQPAVGGNDPVAYFTQGKPVSGTAELNYRWDGATFRFASAANREAFVKDPERYVPQFGGHCAWAASQGRLAGPDPTIWRIVDGRLYLNCSKDAEVKWLADVPGNIARAEAFWTLHEMFEGEP